MRKTFREPPTIEQFTVRKGYNAVFWDELNVISIGNVDYPDVVEALIHELAHWSMTGYLTRREIEKYAKRYTKVVKECTDTDGNCDYDELVKKHTDERFALYVEECYNSNKGD